MIVAELPFVDRGGLLAGILKMTKAVLESAQDSFEPQRAIVVKAPEGAGKSRLMAELAQAVQAESIFLISASCWGDGTSSVEGLQKMVLELAERLGPDSKAVSEHAELIELSGKALPGKGPDQGITSFLLSASYEQGFLLHLADIERGPQWVRALVESLLHTLDEKPAPIALCVTTAPHLKVERLLTDLADDRLIDVWGLPQFSRDELGRIVQIMFGEMPHADDLADMLVTLTGGEPYAVQEALRAMIQEGLLEKIDEVWKLRTTKRATAELEQLLAGRVESRLDALGAGAWEVVTVLFLMGRPVGFDLLADLSDLRQRRFLRMMERLEAEGLVLVAQDEDRHVTLAHQTIREAIRVRSLESLDDRRIDLASRLDELELAEASMIYLRCELLDDAAQNIEAVDELDAGIKALFFMKQHLLGAQLLERNIIALRRHGGVKNIPRLLSTTLTLLDRAPGALENGRRESEHYLTAIYAAQLLDDHRAQTLLWLGLSDRFSGADRNSGDPDATIERLKNAARSAAKSKDRALELRVAGKRAESLLQGGMIDDARVFSDDAIEILELREADDVDVTNIVGARIRLLSFVGDFDEAFRLHEHARPIAARVPVPLKQVYLSGLSFVSTLSGQFTRGLAELEEAIENTRASDTPRLLMSPLHNTGDLYLRLDRLDDAVICFDEALRLCRTYKDHVMASLNQGFLGYSMALRGQVEEGAVLLAEAISEIAGNRGAHVTLIQLRLLQAEVTHLRGNTEQAREELGELIKQFTQAHETSYAGLAEAALARIAASEAASQSG